MTKIQLIVLQFRTDLSLQHEQMCVKHHTDLGDEEILFYNIFDEDHTCEEAFEIIKQYQVPVIIGGSGEFCISKQHADSETQQFVDTRVNEMKEIVEYLFEHNIPTLGLCFGHQLMAHVLGGVLGHPEQMRETGVFKITLNDAGMKDDIANNMPADFYSVLGHQDTVLELPKGAQILASSEKCESQLIKYGQNMYSTQFHPELDADGFRERLALYPSYVQEGKDPFEGLENVHVVTKILGNFLDIAGINSILH